MNENQISCPICEHVLVTVGNRGRHGRTQVDGCSLRSHAVRSCGFHGVFRIRIPVVPVKLLFWRSRRSRHGCPDSIGRRQERTNAIRGSRSEDRSQRLSVAHVRRWILPRLHRVCPGLSESTFLRPPTKNADTHSTTSACPVFRNFWLEVDGKNPQESSQSLRN